MRTVKEMKRDFRRCNTASTAIENVMVIPFLICSFLPIVTFNLSWLWGALLFAIIQSVLHKSNKDKFRNYLIEHEDELYDEDIERLRLPKIPKPKLSKEEQGCWKCSCGEYNQKYETSCHNCGKPQKRNESAPKTWRCECGALNDQSEKVCHRCGKSSELPSLWRCECSAINRPEDTICASCGKPKPDSSAAINQKSAENPVTNNKSASDDEAISSIVKYKELFDSGVITEEEFSAKKKELLKL